MYTLSEESSNLTKNTNVPIMKASLVLILLLAGPMAVGQDNKNQNGQQLQQALDDVGSAKITNMSRTFDNRAINTRGTAFYVTDWRSGVVTIADRVTPYKGQFKLDVMNNRLMVKQPAGDSIWVSADRLSTITLNPLLPGQPAANFRRFATVKADGDLSPASLVRVLNEGTYGALVQLPIRRFYKAAPGDAYSINATINEIRDESVYYVIRPDQTAAKVKLSRRALADAMGEVGKQLDSHAKANNLALKSEKEVVDALAALQSNIR